MTYRSILLSLLISLSAAAEDTPEPPVIAPFTTDGCSRFPDGTFEQEQLWLHCCIEHDRAYWKGGSYRERLNADRELEACVEGLGETGISLLMFVGVRVGGTPFAPTSYRWGYGWPEWRGYKALTKEEQVAVEQALAISTGLGESAQSSNTQ